MAATVTVSLSGQVTPLASLAAIKVTIGGNSVSYTSTAGGLAFDLANALITAGPQDYTPSPTDVIGWAPLGLSTSGFLPMTLAVGTATYTAVAGASTQNGELGTLATCPCTIKLVGIGSATTNHSGLGEIVDGACTESFTGFVLLTRGGHNS